MPEPVMRTIAVSREAFREPPWLDTAVSRALLERVSDGLAPETLRLYRPASVLAFGPSDRLESGYEAARAAARAAGFAPVERLAGGRAAVFHEGTIAFAWTVPDPTPREHIHARIGEIASLIVNALTQLGIDARVGVVPGEYCAGSYSVNARGRTKLMGVGQRIVQHATHIGGVVVVSGADRIRAALEPVYRALALDWDPASVGSVENELGVTAWESVADAIRDAFAERYVLREGALDGAVLERASTLGAQFGADDPWPAAPASGASAVKTAL